MAPADSAGAGAPRPSHRLPRLRRGAGFIAALLCLAALLVVYLLMPAATRLFAPWLEASVKETL